jgi:hypothetical protein
MNLVSLLGKECGLKLFKNKIVIRVFGPNIGEQPEDGENYTCTGLNDKLHTLHCSTDII